VPDPRWTGPPEGVALIFEAGNPASVIANTVVWVTETANNELSIGLSTVNAFATAAQWQGFGALASMVASNGLNLGLQTLVGWTAHKIAVTQAAVEAFTLAASAVIPSLVSITNRAETQVLNATNFMGIHTPAIIERETEYYGEHWPHNSSAGWAYASVLSTLSAALTMPPPAAPMGASPAAPAAAGEALAQAAGQSGMNDVAQLTGQTGQATAAAPADAAGQASSLLQQPMQLISGMTQPLQQLVSAPMQGIQGLTSMPQGLMSSMGGLLQSGGAPNAAAEAGAVAEPVLAGGGAAGGFGATAAGGGGGLGGFPGAGLTSYTRPTSSFEPETGGRPGSPRAGVLNAAEVRGPTASTGMGGSPMPMSPAGMLARGSGGGSDKDAVTRARVVVGGDRMDPD
jgi:PPE-repeat protein